MAPRGAGGEGPFPARRLILGTLGGRGRSLAPVKRPYGARRTQVGGRAGAGSVWCGARRGLTLSLLFDAGEEWHLRDSSGDRSEEEAKEKRDSGSGENVGSYTI